MKLGTVSHVIYRVLLRVLGVFWRSFLLSDIYSSLPTISRGLLAMLILGSFHSTDNIPSPPNAKPPQSDHVSVYELG